MSRSVGSWVDGCGVVSHLVLKYEVKGAFSQVAGDSRPPRSTKPLEHYVTSNFIINSLLY
jgi:hypothetical protein